MEIQLYPNPILRQTAPEVENFGELDLEQTVKEMFEIMYQCGGIGLAAPQAGLSKRIVVANLERKDDNPGKEEVFINPRILKRSGEIVFEEGCLSLPGIRSNMERYGRLQVEYYDLKEKKHIIDAEELLAVLFQHEIDHLDGLLIIDRMNMSQKAEFQQKIRLFEEDFEKGIKRKYEEYKENLL